MRKAGEELSDLDMRDEEVGAAESGVAENDEAGRLRQENERLRQEIERVKELSIKERLYDHVHVSLRTLDIFIGVMIALGVFVVILGLINR